MKSCRTCHSSLSANRYSAKVIRTAIISCAVRKQRYGWSSLELASLPQLMRNIYIIEGKCHPSFYKQVELRVYHWLIRTILPAPLPAPLSAPLPAPPCSLNLHKQIWGRCSWNDYNILDIIKCRFYSPCVYLKRGGANTSC